MDTSPGVFKDRPGKGMSKFPVLPPIEGTQQQSEVDQIAAEKKEIAEKIAVPMKLLRHRRSKVQLKQRQMILYVLSSAMFFSLHLYDLSCFFFFVLLQMNYNFLKQCVERCKFPPVQQQWLDSIVDRVPSKLRASPKAKKLLQELCEEVSDNFHNVTVKYTVGTVLKNPQTEGLSSVKQKATQPKILNFSHPWHESFIRSRRVIKANLHILHPVMQTLLNDGNMTYSSLVLVELSGCRASGPVDCKSLQNKMTVECKRTEDRIMKTWFPNVIHLLTNEETLKGVKEEKLDSFYNCASTLISNQLKSLLHASVEEFVSVFEPSSHHCLPIFRMALTFDDEKIEIYPTSQDLEAAVLEILNKVQTVQSWLAQTTSSFVDAKVDDQIHAWALATVKSAVCKNLEEPEKYFQNYVDSYDWLVNGTAQVQVETFMEEEHSFDEYTKQVEKFRALSKEIMSLPSKAHFTMVHLDCEELKQGLANKAKAYAEMLLKKLVSRHREKNLEICSEFENIRNKALKVPQNTEDMAEVLDFLHVAKTDGLTHLNEKIKEAWCRLTYLLEVCIIEPEDLELNSTVFLWPQNILHIFELSDEVMEKAKQKGENELVAKREKLLVQLKMLGSKIEEFSRCSELNMMHQYVADVRTVQKLLHEAEEDIALITAEEDFYKWDVTCYPEVEVLKENIEPYQKLFGFVLTWQRTERRWMDGSFQDLNGETMEVKLDEFYREIFKMFKFFQQKKIKAVQEMEKISEKKRRHPTEEENPTVRLCSTVMEQIKNFKVFCTIVI
uniref:Dynein heavy chain linker domain-containing protein n=1 Tax=Amphilophus citrinellus TaxID=61819 RepID=A0A3Q0SWQ6_AMPCI